MEGTVASEPDTPNTSSPLDPLDQPIWGAKDIAIAANLVTDKGEPDVRRAFYLLQINALPATKVADGWVTTPRRLRDCFNQQVEIETSGRGRKKQGSR
jgi:hypothetical protein